MMKLAPKKSYLIVTYNRKLCDETKQKFIGDKKLKGTKYDVVTYHSLANRYFQKCFNDDDMEAILKRARCIDAPSVKFNTKPLKFDVIIFDEV